MNTIIIRVKYENTYMPKTFDGKAYSYLTNLDLKVGDLVIAPTVYGDRIARVSDFSYPDEELDLIKPYLKNIEQKIDKEKYLKTDQINVA